MKFLNPVWSKRLWTTVILLPLATTAQASFLEMPDTTEVPEMERETLLKDLDIPGVKERDPDPMAGPRLNVTEFRVQGIVEYPELGITRESLNRLVEGIRFDLMGEGAMLESGYTLDEVSEISDLIAEIEENTQEYVGPNEVQRLVFLIREQRQKRGVTLGMIESVADTITRYYRERGFILAKAYIPEQRVRDGVVTLTLLLGNLGEVEVQNNRNYRASTIRNIFKDQIGEPVTAETIEERLFFVNDLPGLSAQAYFEPGSQVGDTRLNVNLVDETRFNGNMRLDNHGSANTGEYRAYVDGYWHNPTSIGDQLHIGILGTYDPANSLYGSIHYGLPVFGPRTKFTIGGSTNDFISSVSELTLTGKSRVLDASLNYILTRSRVKNYSVEVRLSEVDTDIESSFELDQYDADSFMESPIDQDEYDDIVRNLDLVYNFDVLQERARALHQGALRLTVGDFVKGRNVGQDENPWIIALNYTYLKFVKVPFTKSAQSRVVLKTTGQYAETALPSTNQFVFSGPNRMRGFGINQYHGDRGVLVSADWIFNGPRFLPGSIGGQRLSDLIQPYVFAEAAYSDSEGVGIRIPDEGRYSERTSEPTYATGSDIGFGLKFSFKNTRASFSYAKPTSFTSDVGATQQFSMRHLRDDDKFYFDFMVGF